MKQDWTGIGTGDGAFPLTRLTLLKKAGDAAQPGYKDALEVFWTAYWKPLYAYARREGVGNDEAKDLVQTFCAKAIEQGMIARYDPSQGRLRTWMLRWFRSFLLNELERARAEKRGGGLAALPVEAAREVPAPDSSEREFDRAWALELIERAFDRMKNRLASRTADRWKYEIVRLIHSKGFGKLPSLPDLAGRFGVTEARVGHFIQRDSRRELKEEILLEIREGSPDESDAREELEYLLRCVAQP